MANVIVSQKYVKGQIQGHMFQFYGTVGKGLWH